MRKLNLALVFACLAAPAFADELADAQKLWDNKQFNAAFAAFSKLAVAGNPNAQLQLGEMYGFGEGTSEDLTQARSWLDKAIQAGHPEAANSLALVNRRAARKSDIAYYVSKFDGGSARYENFHCTPPALPEVSSTRKGIEEVNGAIEQWRACYDAFASNLNRVAAPEKTIPADVLDLMNNEEFQQASRHITNAYIDISNSAQKTGANVYENINGWITRTSAYLKEQKDSDKQLEHILRAQRQAEIRNFSDALRQRKEPASRRQ